MKALEKPKAFSFLEILLITHFRVKMEYIAQPTGLELKHIFLTVISLLHIKFYALLYHFLLFYVCSAIFILFYSCRRYIAKNKEGKCLESQSNCNKKSERKHQPIYTALNLIFMLFHFTVPNEELGINQIML